MAVVRGMVVITVFGRREPALQLQHGDFEPRGIEIYYHIPQTGQLSHETLPGLGIDREPIPAHVSVKESVFPFRKFVGVDIVLGPEMRSTGEVMGISQRFSLAFAKSQLAAGVDLPKEGKIFVSVADRHKERIVGLARRLTELGFTVISTKGTAKRLQDEGVTVETVKKLGEGHPNLLDHMIDGAVCLVMNTPNGKGARTDEGKIRAAAVQHGIPCITTIQAAEAAVMAMEAMREGELNVEALQDRYKR